MRLSERVYGSLLRLYPDRFLSEHREPLQQLFRDQLRDAEREEKRIQLWIGTIVDLLCSVPVVHLYTTRYSPMKRINWIAYLLCVAAMAFFFLVGSQSDDVGIVTGLIVLTTFVLGGLSPRRAWKWALLIGLSLPLANLFSELEVAPVAGIPGSLVVAAFLVTIGMVGSYAGTLVHKAVLSAFKSKAENASA